MGAIALLSFLVVLGVLGLYIWFMISLQTAMNTVSQQNRKMDGGLVWLNLIPLFNFVWTFVFNIALRNSYRKEFQSKGIREEVSLASGIVYPTLYSVMFIIPLILLMVAEGAYSHYSMEYVRFLEFVSIVSGALYLICGIGSFIFLIVFWTKVNSLKALLLSKSQYSGTIDSVVPQQVYVNPEPVQVVNQNYPPVTPVPSEPLKVEPPAAEIKPKQETAVEKLKKYHDMLNSGLITQDDFDRIKKEILKG
jgi:hypothetical protein